MGKFQYLLLFWIIVHVGQWPTVLAVDALRFFFLSFFLIFFLNSWIFFSRLSFFLSSSPLETALSRAA